MCAKYFSDETWQRIISRVDKRFIFCREITIRAIILLKTILRNKGRRQFHLRYFSRETE